MIYKAPDVQSTNVKHDSSMAVICLENMDKITPFDQDL